MSHLRQLFANPFHGESISDDALRIFTYDHLQKLAAANVGEEFNARLTDTVTAYSAFGGVITGYDLNRSLQIAATAEMFLRWSAFRGWMEEHGEPRIRNKAGEESVLYNQFLPEGLGELQKVTLHNAGPLLDRLVTLVNGPHSKNGDLLGTEWVTTVALHRRQFFVARHAQLALKGEFLVGILDRDIARGALEIQLFDNALALLQRHRKLPLHAMQYFHLGLLEYAVPPAPTSWPASLVASRT